MVLALVLFLPCEELQSYFFSEYIRKAVNSCSRSVPWQTLQAQSHKCFGAPAIPTSSRAPMHPSGGDLHSSRLAHRHSNSDPLLSLNTLLEPPPQAELAMTVYLLILTKIQFPTILASFTETKTCSFLFINSFQLCSQ